MEDPHAGTENLFSSLLSHMGNALDTSAADTSYHPYPASRPFINTDYQRQPEKRAMTFPESNRDGVMSALKNLQERMQRLEVERRAAEINLRQLSTDTEAFKTSLRNRDPPPHRATTASISPRRPPSPTPASRQSQFSSHDSDNTRPKARELESQLSSAETRCQMLENQLHYMRRMVQTAEQNRVEAVQNAEALKQQQQQSSPRSPLPDYCAQLERISELERDHLRLTATQTLAESKIRELEKKLSDERDHRKMLQERALDLESAAVSHQILLNNASSPPFMPPPPAAPKEVRLRYKKPQPPVTTKKKKLVSRKQVPPRPMAPSKHYRLNLADIPFVAGKSTAPSHAVGANVQKVLALMKAHNLALCSSLYNGQNNHLLHHHHHGQRQRQRQPRTGRREGSLSPSSSLSYSSSDLDLADLLAQLQDEFGQLSCEHQDLLRQIEEEKDLGISEAIEKELDNVLHRMEAKGQQISSVRQHQQKMEEGRQQARSRKEEHVPRPATAMGRMQQAAHTKPPQAQSAYPCGRDHARPRSASGEKNPRVKNQANPSLDVLRNMKKLQHTLGKDDLHWE